MKKDLIEYDFVYYFVRVLLILFYPIYLIIGLIDAIDWEDFREGALIPFQKWGKQK